MGVDSADRSHQALVEGPDDGPGLVRRLVEEIVPGHPDVVFVVVGDGFPDVDGTVLEVPVFPEQRPVGGVVRMPVVVL